MSRLGLEIGRPGVDRRSGDYKSCQEVTPVPKVCGLFQRLILLGVVAHACNPSSCKMKAGRSESGQLVYILHT